MDDLRQKLFPIFLGEAERNLAALRLFLEHEDLSSASAVELETAFRAAHTLKGTANLVKADSICKIARRLEALLEKHFEAQTKPTKVEHEAMQLAVDWLAPLVSALQGDLQEPKLFVAEALQALELAEAFPGRTPLVELLNSHAERRSPQLDDPFAGDPDMLSEEAELLQADADPFAADPSFGMEIDLVSSVKASGAPRSNIGADAVDPFAEDHELVLDEPDFTEVAAESVSTGEQAAEDLPFDPFADDDLGLDVEPVDEQFKASPEASAEESPAEESEPELEATASEFAETASTEDPFGEDEYFGNEFDLGADGVAEQLEEDDGEADPFVAAPETVAERAGEIAESLLLPQEETTPRKDYVCCVFSIGGRHYHLPIKQMLEIADLPPVLPLPLAPPMVSGLINLRGQVLPVINLAILNQHQEAEVRLQRRLVIAEHRGESLAFLADGVPFLAEDFSGEKIDMSKFLSLYRIRGGEA